MFDNSTEYLFIQDDFKEELILEIQSQQKYGYSVNSMSTAYDSHRCTIVYTVLLERTDSTFKTATQRNQEW